MPIVQGPGRAPGLVWTGVGILAATGIRSLDHPAHGELLCNEAILRPVSIKIKIKSIKWALYQNVSEILSPYKFLFTLFSPMLISEHLYKFCTFHACIFPYYFIIISFIFLPAVVHFDFLVTMLCGTHI